MEKLQEFFDTLTPSELDELAPAGFDAKAPRGALKRIEKSAVEKAGVRPAKRKRCFKPLMIAAAAAVVVSGTLFTVNATDWNIIKFTLFGEDVEGEYRDYVDHDGYRHVRFEAVVPIDLENYAILIDVDEPDPDKAVQVFTEETHPELFEQLAEHYLTNNDESTHPEGGYRYEIDWGIELTESQYISLIWTGSFIDENGMEKYISIGRYSGGEFMDWKGDPTIYHYAKRSDIAELHEEDGTKTIGQEFIYYVGK